MLPASRLSNDLRIPRDCLPLKEGWLQPRRVNHGVLCAAVVNSKTHHSGTENTENCGMLT